MDFLTALVGVVFIVLPYRALEALPSLFRTVLEISLTMTAVVGLLLLLRPLLKKHYRAKWMYWAWLLLAVRLVVPVNFSLPVAPVAVSAPGMTIYRHETVRTNPGFHEFVLLSPEDYQQAKERENAAVAAGAEMTGGDIKNYYSPVFTLSQIGSIIWCGGIGVVFTLEMISYARFRRRIKRWQSPLEDARFEALKAELGVKKLALAQCSAISSPMVTGFVHPTLLLPETDAPDAVLRHELVHAKRRDLWYKLLLVFTRAVHWFNPLVWLMARQASQDLELSCDEAVVAGRDEGFRAGYGRAILDAVDSGKGKERAPLTTYFHGGKKAMLERLQSIVNTKARRRGVIALVLVLALAVSASAVCVINPPMQTVDGGSYTLNVPANITVKLTEEMPEGFNTSYYKAGFYRDGPIGSAHLLLVPGFDTMTTEERVAALDVPNHLEAAAYISPGGLEGVLAKNTPTEYYYFSMGGNQVFVLYFYLGPKFDDFFEGRFTHGEIDAMLSSIITGGIDTPNPKGDFTLTVDFTEDEALWHLWDTSRNPKLLETTRVPAKHRIWAEPLWSEDGKWAAVPSGDGDLKWNYRIFGVGKEGFAQDFPVTLDAMLSKDYTPVPDSMELRAMKFVGTYGAFPTLALSYSLLDTEGNLQSGTLNYNCMPPEVSATLTGYAPTTDITQNTPLVPTGWQEGGHSFSLLLTEGSTVSPADGSGARTFTGPNGEYLGKIYKVEKKDAWNQTYQASNQTAYYAWLDETDDLCYQLEICETDLPLNTSTRMVYDLTMDGKLIDFYYENQNAKPETPIDENAAYTQADVDSAMEAARRHFAENQNRQLNSLWFDPEKLGPERTEYKNYGRGASNGVAEENIMVLFCEFSYTDDVRPSSDFETKTGWMLIFIRESADAPWVLDDQGY